MSSKSRNHKKNIMMKIITTPIRVLSKARDLYVKSLINYANHASFHGRTTVVGGSTLGYPAFGLPKSFSVNSNGFQYSEDLRELIRANSVGSTTGSRTIGREQQSLWYVEEQHLMIRQQSTLVSSPKRVPRSCSVGMARIDEEKSFHSKKDFDDVKVPRNRSVFNFARSRSSAVGVTKK